MTADKRWGYADEVWGRTLERWTLDAYALLAASPEHRETRIVLLHPMNFRAGSYEFESIMSCLGGALRSMQGRGFRSSKDAAAIQAAIDAAIEAWRATAMHWQEAQPVPSPAIAVNDAFRGLDARHATRWDFLERSSQRFFAFLVDFCFSEAP